MLSILTTVKLKRKLKKEKNEQGKKKSIHLQREVLTDIENGDKLNKHQNSQQSTKDFGVVGLVPEF